jgi:hypothetical protein
MRRTILTAASPLSNRRNLATLFLFFLIAAPGFAQIIGDHEVAPPVFGPAPSYVREYAAASDGTDYLVAWIESSRGPAGDGKYSIYAARVLADGTVVDRGGILIAPIASTIGQGLNVVWAGDAFAVLWEDAPAFVNQVFGARVSRDGGVVDPPRSLGQGFLQQRQAVSNGDRILLIGGGGAFTLLDRNLNLVSGPLSTGAGTSFAVASNGSDFIVLATYGSITYAERVAANGQVDVPQPLGPAPPGFYYDSVASDGRDYLIAYSRSSTSTTSVYGLRHISTAGLPEELSAISIPTQAVSLAWTGDNYLLFTDAGTAWRFDRHGQLLPGTVTLPSVAGTLAGMRPVIVSSKSEALLIWSTGSEFSPPLMAQRLSGGYPSGNLIVPVQSANAQREPAIAFSGSEYAVVWSERDSVYLSRLSIDGKPLDGRGVRLGDGLLVSHPQIVFDGTNFVVVWVVWQGNNQPVRMMIQRVSPDPASALGSSSLVSQSNCLGSISLSAGINATLVTWSDCSNLMAAALPSSGVLGAPLKLATGRIGGASTAWNGSEWLIVWEDAYFYGDSVNVLPIYGANLVGARLTAAMTPLDAKPIAIATGSIPPGSQTSPFSQSGPVVASDGADFLVAWSRADLRFATPSSMQLRYVTAGGTTLGDAEGARVDDGSPTAAVWDGASYAILYSHNHGLLLARARRSTDAPAAGIQLASPGYESALAVTGPSALTLVYTRTATDPSYGGVGRSYIRSLGAPVRGRSVRAQ